ncbi:MAG: TolC family protein [Acidobacteria bacterium]|nr:TolC family protein [Acidobacteriota bacterium]
MAESRLTAQAQQIALEVRNALTQVDMHKARIEAAQKARELIERRLEAEQKKFDLGASTIRFVSTIGGAIRHDHAGMWLASSNSNSAGKKLRT